MGFFSKLFAGYSERELNKIRHYVDEINALEPKLEKYSDEEYVLKQKSLNQD